MTKKLFVVYKHYDYEEGNSEPIAVCSSRRRAEKYKDCEVIELELNKPIHKPLQHISLPVDPPKSFIDLPDFVIKPYPRGRGLLDLWVAASESPAASENFSWIPLDRNNMMPSEEASKLFHKPFWKEETGMIIEPVKPSGHYPAGTNRENYRINHPYSVGGS